MMLLEFATPAGDSIFVNIAMIMSIEPDGDPKLTNITLNAQSSPFYVPVRGTPADVMARIKKEAETMMRQSALMKGVPR